MKKIVSIVLALVLVLAIAAPAMAITGYVAPAAETTAASAPYALKLTLVDAAASGLGILSLNAAAANKAYVANEVIYGKVEIAGNTDTTWDVHDFKDAKLVISSTAAVLQQGNVYAIDYGTGATALIGTGVNGAVTSKGELTLDATKNTLTYDLEAVTQKSDIKSYTVLFCGVVKAKGAITATLTGGDDELFVDNFAEDAAIADCESLKVSIYDDNGNLLYEVTKSSQNYIVKIVYGKNAGYVVTFVCTVENVCDKIDVGDGNSINDQEVKFFVPVSNGGSVVNAIGDYTAATDAAGNVTTFAKLKAAYDEVMNFFGFNYDAEGLLLDAHFVCKLHSFNATDAVTVNLYTAAITVPDADVDIPQTGDAATTLGFVMIAMAIVAAAAVAYKKVRA